MAELGTNWKAFVIQFIPAILGSGVFVSTIISSYSEFYNKPNIEIAILPDQSTGTKTSIILSNKGTVPATDLKLIAIMPENISYVDSFSLERITVHNESNTLEVMMPRLVQGEGSVTTINLAAQEPLAANDTYQVYAIYDQGSTKGRVYNSLSEVEGGTWTPMQLLALGLLITAALVAYTIILPRLLGYRYYKKVSGHVNSVHTEYIKSNKGADDKVRALVELQEITNYIEKRFSFKLMTNIDIVQHRHSII